MSELTLVHAPSHEPLHVALRDGSVVDVRPLERSDRAAFADAVARLSDHSRYLRFAAAKPRLTERELDFLTDVDHHGHEALVALDPATQRVVAAGRYVAIAEEHGAVEVAAAVGDSWQGRGLGGALLAELVQRARDEGYSVIRASVLAINAQSINMLRRAGFTARAGGDGGLREFELPLSRVQ